MPILLALEEPAAQALLRIGAVIGYMQEHYVDKITLDGLAGIGCVSQRTLARTSR